MAFFIPYALGALEIGCLFSIFLFGVVTLQTFVYLRKFPDDRWILKAVVRILHRLRRPRD